jgi:hypothetical protein
MMWAKKKRDQEEAENAKLMARIFPSKGPYLTKKNQPTCSTILSERPSLKSASSATSMRSSFTLGLKNNSPTFRSNKLDDDPCESKLMRASKKIAKYQPSTQGPQYKRATKKPIVDVASKLPRKIFKEDIKRSTSQNGRDYPSKNAAVTKSVDLKMLNSASESKDVQFNKYRAAMRIRKVTCDLLKYKSFSSKKEHKFRCFKEKDLGIPRQYSAKIIHHHMDNDCYTDDEQMKLAVKNLYFSLRLANEEIM